MVIPETRIEMEVGGQKSIETQDVQASPAAHARAAIGAAIGAQTDLTLLTEIANQTDQDAVATMKLRTGETTAENPDVVAEVAVAVEIVPAQ